MIANSNKELLYQFKALISDSISDLKRANEATASKQMQEIKRIKRDPEALNFRVVRANKPISITGMRTPQVVQVGDQWTC